MTIRESMCGRKRDESLDAVAGLLILYTIMIHLCPGYELGEFVGRLHYVFFFFMAWFFFKAGMFFNWNNDIRKELRYSSKRLVIPLITFSLFGIVLDDIRRFVEGDTVWVHYVLSPIKEFFCSGYTNANSALWFLPTMIIVRIIGTQTKKVPVLNKKLSLVILTAFSIVLFISLNRLRDYGIITLPIYCYNVPLALAFFLMGGVIKQLHNNRTVVIVCLVGVIVTVTTCFSNIIFMGGTLVEGQSEVMFIIESVMGIIAIDGIFRFAMRVYSFPILRHFGRNTLSYFGLHMPVIAALSFCGFSKDSSFDYVLLYLAILIVISVIMSIVRYCKLEWIIGE